MSANPPRAPGELAEIKLRAFAESMRAWGENDPNPEWFADDCLSMMLADCGRAGALIDTLLDEIASLRSATGDGGETMREAAAALCDEEAQDQRDLAVAHLGSDERASDTAYGAEEAARTLAAVIRALQPRSTKIEGAGE